MTFAKNCLHLVSFRFFHRLASPRPFLILVVFCLVGVILRLCAKTGMGRFHEAIKEKSREALF